MNSNETGGEMLKALDSLSALEFPEDNIKKQIFELLLQFCGIDFMLYKQSSIVRRMERRMEINGFKTLDIYFVMLQNDKNELSELARDLLIGVTAFFRDAGAFELIRKQVIPKLIENKTAEHHIRVWVAGCSTGEEAYSLAILFQEQLEMRKLSFTMKIFATDLDKEAIDFAGRGIYTEEAVKGLSPKRLKTHFTKNGSLYQVNKNIRKMIVFAHHNVMKDPPFSSMDFISCRNMLIYFQPQVQQKVLSFFHYALNTNGFLLLGPSETIGSMRKVFTPLNRKWNIFRKGLTKNGISASNDLDLSRLNVFKLRHLTQKGYSNLKDSPNYKKTEDLYSIFVDEHMPPSLVIDEHNEVLHLCGSINPYLSLAHGKPSSNIYKMVEAHLATAIVNAIEKVRKEKEIVYYKEIRVNHSENSPYINLLLKPFSFKNTKHDNLVLVSFEETSSPQQPIQPIKIIDSFDMEINANQRIVGLEQELQRAEESLQATIEELESSNEELQTTNEELVATNEELMSTNEELQSVNEELVTVNTEYQFKIQELTDLNNDMDNLMASTKIGTIFLDKDMCIRRFTPAATKEINLLDVDFGRPFSHISHNFMYNGMVNDAKNVLKTLVPEEREIQSTSGFWYSMRVLPYRTKDHVIKGIVLTFVDITDLKSANVEMRKLSSVVEQTTSLILIANTDGTIQYANPKLIEVTQYDPESAKAMHFRELYHWEASGVSFTEIWNLLIAGGNWKGELEISRKNGDTLWVSAKILPIKDEAGKTIQIMKIAEDISDRKKTEELLRKSEMLSAVGQLAAGIAHEIRNPLTALKGFTKLLRSGQHNDNYLSIMSAELERIEEIVSELLVLAKPQAIDYLPKSVSSILNDVVMLLDTQAIMNNVEIINEIDEQLPLVSCVENQLKQVFINVLKNGVEAMPGGGKLIMRTTMVEEHRVKISFIDHGCGIPEKTLARLGDPFYTTKSNGTGLGLMVSYKIIENHQGKMLIYSRENVGTTVDILLPTITKARKQIGTRVSNSAGQT